MTLGKNYLEQLKASAISMRQPVPVHISQAVVDKVNLVNERLNSSLPESIIYANPIDTKRFSSKTHLARVRFNGWRLEIVKATKKSNNEEVVVAIIYKVGSLGIKSSVTDRRNGNNPIRTKAIKR